MISINVVCIIDTRLHIFIWLASINILKSEGQIHNTTSFFFFHIIYYVHSSRKIKLAYTDYYLPYMLKNKMLCMPCIEIIFTCIISVIERISVYNLHINHNYVESERILNTNYIYP